MAIKTEAGVTTLSPTSWKWYTGAALILLVAFYAGGEPMFVLMALFAAGVFLLTGAGLMQEIRLAPDGLHTKSWANRKHYRWDEIGEIRTTKIKSGFMTAANMVSFTHANQEGTMLGKAAKVLAGGTHSIPTVGTSAKQLAALMMAYKMGEIPEDTVAVSPVTSKPASPHSPVAATPTTRRPASKVAVAPRASFGQKSSGGALVQDGGWRRRQTR
ncbi:MAG: hypothetical protein AAGJ29_06235 [Pseudomonadota bacterium]